LKVGNTDSISAVKYSVLNTFMMPCLCNGHACLALMSLTGFSHKIFKHKTIVKYYISHVHIRQCFIFSVAVCIGSHSSHLLSFIDVFAQNQQLTFLTHSVYYNTNICVHFRRQYTKQCFFSLL